MLISKNQQKEINESRRLGETETEEHKTMLRYHTARGTRQHRDETDDRRRLAKGKKGESLTRLGLGIRGLIIGALLSQVVVGEKIVRGILHEIEPKIGIISGVLIISVELETEKIKTIFGRLPLEEQEAKVNRLICDKYLNGRRKRGLIDVGGQVLHVLFGVATDHQVDGTKADMKILTVKMNRLHRETRILSQALDEQNEQLNQTVTILKKNQQVDRVLRLCIAYDKLREEARENKLEVSTLDTVQLEMAIDQFRTKHNLGAAGSVYSAAFQKSLRTLVIKNRIIISIPFMKAERWTHWKLTPIPMFINGTRVIMEIRTKNVIFNRKTEEIGFLTKEVVDKCLHIGEEYLCRSTTIYKTADVNRCESEIVFRKPMETCKFTKVEENEVKIITTSSKLYISETPRRSVTVKCDDKLEHKIVGESGLMIIPRGCTVVSQRFRFEDTKTVYGGEIGEIRLGNETNKLLNLDNHTLEKLRGTISQLGEEEEVWEEIGGQNWGMMLGAVSLGLTGMGVLVAILGFWVWFRKSGQGKETKPIGLQELEERIRTLDEQIQGKEIKPIGLQELEERIRTLQEHIQGGGQSRDDEQDRPGQSEDKRVGDGKVNSGKNYPFSIIVG